MKDPNLSELVRTCIRCWLYLVPQAFLGIHLFDMFMGNSDDVLFGCHHDSKHRSHLLHL